jgi:hypothetical protein
MLMTGTIDPEGVAGGPVVSTASDPFSMYGKLSWLAATEDSYSSVL